MLIKRFFLIVKSIFVKNPVDIAIKNGAKIGDDCRLINVTFGTEPYLVKIGNHVSATDTHIETHDGGVWVFRDKHPLWDIIKPVIIGNNVYIGKGCLILPGTIIEDNVVIGAGSIVTGVLFKNTIYAGVPAKKIKTLDEYYEKCEQFKFDTKGLSFQLKKKLVMKRYKN
ncbi:acyltransferase [Photobacterium damselae subsp. damselae]|uniref:Acyltransferase n=1 Tax=Photobacterium damselae subsp. damselae TaxID=85581 RepID=A0A850R0Z5_PHODD|nr:acyltransferase [Photobacterium damselae subsp. damselae]